MGIGTTNFMYESWFIERYINSLPLWRRTLARYFTKYKVTREEYDEWFFKELLAKK